MRQLPALTALLLLACGQGDYSFSVDNDVGDVIVDTATDSGPIVWEDCGIAGASSTEVTVDHTCTGDAGLAADLKVEITDVCFPSCEEGAPVFVAVQVRNQGGVDVSGTVPLAVYAGAASAGSGDVPLHTFSHTGGVTAGSVAAGQVIDFDVRALNGQPIRIEVNDDGTGDWAVQECDLLNNQAVYDANPCPATE